MRHILGLFALLVISAPASAQLDRISNADAVGGLKQALNDGSIAAVAKLGVENGYFGNPQVKIPLPPSLKRAEGAMRALGMRRHEPRGRGGGARGEAAADGRREENERPGREEDPDRG
jgi:hypothetical protein